MKQIKFKNINLLVLITSVVLSLILVFALVFYSNFEKPKIKNVKCIFSHVTVIDKPVSCQVKINDSIYFKYSDVSKVKDPLLELKKGSYTMEVSDIDGNFTTISNFKITEDNERKYIYISFWYFASYEEYLPIYKKNYFEEIIKRKEYSVEEKVEIEKKANRITLEDLKASGYEPRKASFEVKVLDQPYMTD